MRSDCGIESTPTDYGHVPVAMDNSTESLSETCLTFARSIDWHENPYTFRTSFGAVALNEFQTGAKMLAQRTLGIENVYTIHRLDNSSLGHGLAPLYTELEHLTEWLSHFVFIATLDDGTTLCLHGDYEPENDYCSTLSLSFLTDGVPIQTDLYESAASPFGSHRLGNATEAAIETYHQPLEATPQVEITNAEHVVAKTQRGSVVPAVSFDNPFTTTEDVEEYFGAATIDDEILNAIPTYRRLLSTFPNPPYSDHVDTDSWRLAEISLTDLSPLDPAHNILNVGAVLEQQE